MKTVVIITEGTVVLGLGHIQRMLTLARSLAGKHRITFITQSGNLLMKRIKDAGFEVEPAKLGYEKALSKIGEIGVVLIDQLTVDKELAIWVRKHTKAHLIIFGNLSDANRYAHVVVNAVIGTRHFENRRRIDLITGTLYLEGPRYIMLGEPYRKRCNTYRHRGVINHILILFGGSDQANLTCRVVQQLIVKQVKVEITACVGLLYPYKHELKSLCQTARKKNIYVNVLVNSKIVHDLMLQSDCVFTSPGNSLFEAMALGVPAVAFFQTDDQASIFRGFPMTYEQKKIDCAYELAVEVYDNYSAYQHNIRKLDIGGGYWEICRVVSTNIL